VPEGASQGIILLSLKTSLPTREIILALPSGTPVTFPPMIEGIMNRIWEIGVGGNLLRTFTDSIPGSACFLDVADESKGNKTMRGPKMRYGGS